MRRSLLILLLAAGIFALNIFNCVSPPLNPIDDPKNASLSLFLPDKDNTVQVGKSKRIGLEVGYSWHIKTITVSSSCGDIDTSFTYSSMNTSDTVFLDLVFKNEGSCVLSALGAMVDDQINERTDTISLHVFGDSPALSFITVPMGFTTHTGRSDTLRFAISSSQAEMVNYTVSSTPELDPGEMYLLEAADDDSAIVYFNPQQPGAYTVTLGAAAGDQNDAASVPITVLASLSPREVDNPQTLITGMPDTLVYTLTPEQIASGVTIGLVDPQNLPADAFTIIPSGTDSIIIAVNSALEGQLSFSIATSNGTLIDTMSYTITVVDQSNAVWKTTSATVDAVEGLECSVELSQYLFDGVSIDAIAPTPTLGDIDENGTWHFTSSWGSEATVAVLISGQRGEVVQYLSLLVNVTPGDNGAPIITLLSPATESKTVSSTQTTVSVIAKDVGAGVDNVTFATASETVVGSKEDDSTWSAVISGLVQNSATEVIITATDKSMKKNNSSRTISLTYNPGMEDNEGPVITQVNGPQSGDRVTAASGTITCTISDDNGVDSVWWKLNGEFAGAVAASDNEYGISFILTTFGENNITVYAKDGSGSGNEGSRAITLNYNTEVMTVTPSGPQDGAADVSLTPQFTWTGGTDEDGDSVFYQVRYGTSATALSQMTSVLTTNIVTLGTAQQLSPTTDYFWQVIAWSKAFPDTVTSAVVSFKTLDPTAEDHTGPQIAQTAGPVDGERVTTAEGSITISVSDHNGVASVTAKVNSGAAQALTAGANNTYVYDFTLGAYGANTVTFSAVDGSANSNPSEETITLSYNTEPTAITLTAPASNGTGVSTSPTFKWSGGDDADGDDVTFTVHYGTSQANLTGTASVTGNTASISTDLDYNETYFWQVTATSASTAFPDEVQSAVGSFTTGGSLPTISVHPANQTKEEEQNVTFSVTASASGFGTLSYQWRQNGTTNVGTNSSSYTITSVTTAMDGNTYDCVVSNDVGSETSDAATLTVTAIPYFTVSFVTDGGTPKPQNQSIKRGSMVSRPSTDPVRTDGYKFRDWYELNASHNFYFNQTPITGDLTLYAGWAKLYRVTYRGNNNTSGNVPTDGAWYENGARVGVKSNTGNLQRNSYTFNGWNTNSSGTGTHYNENGSFYMGSNDVVLYAEWGTRTVTVTYHKYIGSIANDPGILKQSETFTYGESVTFNNPWTNSVSSEASSSGWLTSSFAGDTHPWMYYIKDSPGTTTTLPMPITLTEDMDIYIQCFMH